jgi:FixJ family two-component response regulator
MNGGPHDTFALGATGDGGADDACIDLKSNLPKELLLLSRRIREQLAGELKMDSRRLHVAILDDDKSVRTAIGRLLNASDMEAEAFATGVELFTSLEKSRPDCLVLDLQMPGVNGLDVLNYLAQLGIHVPTVMITAHDEPNARAACLEAGAFVYLRKPLDAGELLSAITNAVTASLC